MVLCRGTINQAFGNWQGTSQTLELMIVAVPPDAILPDGITLPLNISFRWPFRTSLADAIKATLSVAMPSYSVNVNISPNLVYTEDFAGYYWTITQFAQMLYKLSKGILKAQDYSGISVVVESQTINVFDGTVQPPVKSIAFTDLIGQPTWMGVSQINFKCVMRADIHVGDHVTLPKVQTTTTAASNSQFRDRSIFQGTFEVQSVRHIGNSRGQDANNWVTVFDAFFLNPPNGALNDPGTIIYDQPTGPNP